MGHSVDEFYDHLKTTSDAGRKLPNWCVVTILHAWRTLWTDFSGARRGELYLEVSLCPCLQRVLLTDIGFVSSTAGPIPHTVREIIYPFVLGLRSILTSQPGSIKKGNRKSEILLRDAEVGSTLGQFLSLTSSVCSKSPRSHPSIKAKSTNTQRRLLTTVGKRFS
jgi:hypothetical protein